MRIKSNSIMITHHRYNNYFQTSSYQNIFPWQTSACEWHTENRESRMATTFSCWVQLDTNIHFLKVLENLVWGLGFFFKFLKSKNI